MNILGVKDGSLKIHMPIKSKVALMLTFNNKVTLNRLQCLMCEHDSINRKQFDENKAECFKINCYFRNKCRMVENAKRPKALTCYDFFHESQSSKNHLLCEHCFCIHCDYIFKNKTAIFNHIENFH